MSSRHRRNHDATTVRIARVDHEHLVLDGLGLALAFFAADPSSAGTHSFDSLAGRGVLNQITIEDVTAINSTMRARSSHARWTPIANRDLDWLVAIAPDLDLLGDETRWRQADGPALARAALAGAIGPGRGPSVATKVLHVKRPHLFPVLDAFVAQMLGVNMPDDGSHARRVEIAWTLMAHLREQGRANLPALVAIKARLSEHGFDRPLVRILDAIVWYSHPAAGVPGASREIAVRVR